MGVLLSSFFLYGLYFEILLKESKQFLLYIYRLIIDYKRDSEDNVYLTFVTQNVKFLFSFKSSSDDK